MKNILFLHTHVVHYTIGVLNEILSIQPDFMITVIYYDKYDLNKSQYKIDDNTAINFIKRSDVCKQDIHKIIQTLKPEIIYIPGWMDKEYLWAVFKHKKNGNFTKVVAGIDDIWFGTLRQRVGSLYFKLFYKKYIDYFWVAGKPQYNYAQRFGYDAQNIISNLLSADKAFFYKANISKRFVFVGRLVDVKGIELLLNAYNLLPSETRRQWPLVIIGDGQLKSKIQKKASSTVKFLPYLQKETLLEELCKGGVLCLPSLFEQWGVIIHEAAALGYPLLISSKCGANTEFLIHNYNGFIFESGSVKKLSNGLQRFIDLSDKQLGVFSTRSFELANRIKPIYSAYSLISILDNKKEL